MTENEISKREQKLYACAKEHEECSELRVEIATWESEFGEDGLEDV